VAIVMEFYRGIKLMYQCDWNIPGTKIHYPHTHSYSELYFHIDGNCTYMVENGIYSLPYGTVILTRPDEIHCVRIEEPCTYERYYYIIPTGALDDFKDDAVMRCFFDRQFGYDNSLILSSEDMEKCREILKSSHDRLKENMPDCRSLALSGLLNIMHIVNDSFSNRSAQPEKNVYSDLVNGALKFINTNLPDISSTSEIAEALFVNRSYLSDKFHKCTGTTLSRYITLKRISMAKHLLSEGQALDDVYIACGWSDYSYFISVFRKETGITPLKYREMMAKDK